MTVDDLLNKLYLAQYWTPLPTSSYIKNWQGSEAQLNLAWVLAGRPRIDTSTFFVEHLDSWIAAWRICHSTVESCKVKDSLSVMRPHEFIAFVYRYPGVFTRFYPLKRWGELFEFANEHS